MAVADRRNAAQGREAQGLLIAAETETARGPQRRPASLRDEPTGCAATTEFESGGPVCLNYSRRRSAYPV